MDKNCIEINKIIAVIRGVDGLKLLRLAEALSEGGIKIMEVAFNGDDAETAYEICQLKNLMDGRVFIGAGTVTDVAQVEIAKRAGAEFIVSPNTDKEIIAATKEAGLVSVAGALTPTEVAVALKAGADYIKIFPADTMGAGYVKALKAPFSSARFVAMSGINLDNVVEFMHAGYSAVGVSAILQEKKVIDEGNFDEITRRAAALVAAANE